MRTEGTRVPLRLIQCRSPSVLDQLVNSVSSWQTDTSRPTSGNCTKEPEGLKRATVPHTLITSTYSWCVVIRAFRSTISWTVDFSLLNIIYSTNSTWLPNGPRQLHYHLTCLLVNRSFPLYHGCWISSLALNNHSLRCQIYFLFLAQLMLMLWNIVKRMRCSEELWIRSEMPFSDPPNNHQRLFTRVLLFTSKETSPVTRRV